MALDEYKEWVEPSLLETRGEQEHQVKAGAEPILQEAIRRTDLLTTLLKARGRHDVAKGLSPNRLVDGAHNLLDGISALALIAIQCVGQIRGAKQGRCFAKQVLHGWVVWQYHGRKELRRRASPGPMIVGEHLDLVRMLPDHATGSFHHNMEEAAARFCLGYKKLGRE
ncbi:MAG TPA: hypothetical protein VG963_01715 [Polyangiaceae bacterium]|nr:hypothetical protein [Polyangiaceae bacterium]